MSFFTVKGFKWMKKQTILSKKNIYIYVMKEKKIEVNFLEIILIYNKHKRRGKK